MKDRMIRLTKALTNESVKRLPWMLLIFLVLLFIQFVRFNAQTAENTRIAKANSVDNKTLLTKVAQLSGDNKKLSQQAVELARINTEQQKCFFNIFVDAINKGTAPKRVDVDNCTTIVTKAPGQSGVQLSTPSSQQSKSNQSVVPSSGNNNSPSTPSQPDNSQQEEEPAPQLLNCSVDILFLHLGCS